MLDEYLSFQVVELVLVAYGKQALGFQRKRSSVLVESADFDALGTLHEVVNPRHRKAAFLDIGNTVGFHDFRVHQHHERVAPFGYIYDDDLLMDVDLSSSQPDSGSRVHGFGHVG